MNGVKLIFIVYLVMQINIINAQITAEWMSTYSASNDADIAYAMALDEEGNVYVTGIAAEGNNRDILTLKYDNSGEQQWVRRFGGITYDEAFAIAISESANVYVAGYSNSNFVIIKYNTNGDQIWTRQYNGPGNGDDVANSIVIDNNENIYVSGKSTGIGTYDDYALVKCDSAGNIQWVQRYNGSDDEYDQPSSMALDNLGNIFVTGFSYQDSTDADFCTIKYSPSGVELWVQHYNGSVNGPDASQSISLDKSGNVYVTGYTRGSETLIDFATIKYDNNGNLQWIRKYNGEGFSYDEGNCVKISFNTGDVYVTGKSAQNGKDFDYLTIKYSSTGEQQWVQRYNGTGNYIDNPYSLAIDSLDNVYVTGFSFGNITGHDMVTIKYDSSGVQQWVERLDGSAHHTDVANKIIVDAKQNVYLTGSITQTGTYVDFVTLKLSSPVGITTTSIQIPEKYTLSQNYPNPFNPVTKIKFDITRNERRETLASRSGQNVKLVVYDALGREVQTLVNQKLPPGSYETEFNGGDFSSGVYFYKLETENFSEVRKMFLLK